MSFNVRVAVGIMTCGLLVSCGDAGVGGSGAEESNQFCHTIPTNAITCTNCAQVSDSGAAFDGHFGTFASIDAGGQGTFLGTSTLQPAGSLAGVYFVLPNPAGISVTITTFLNGIQQEAGAPATRQTPSDNCSGVSMECSFTDGGGSFVGIGTTKAYNAIQAVISNSSAGTVEVNELCVR